MPRLALPLVAVIAILSLSGCAAPAAAPTFTYAPPASTAPAASTAAAVVSPSAAAPSASELAAPSPSAAANTIQLSEWKVAMPTEVKAGMVTFTITNIGAVPHELIGFRSALDPVAYPRKKDGDVNEEGKGIVSATDGDNIDPAGTQTRTINLTTPGRYVFMCNIPGHFVQGMYLVVNVTP